MYYYIECRTLKVTDRLLMLSIHIMTMMFQDNMTMTTAESMSHSTCLSDPLTHMFYDCRIDIDRKMFLLAL